MFCPTIFSKDAKLGKSAQKNTSVSWKISANYEDIRSERIFNQMWVSEFPWLSNDNKDKSMTCSVFVKHDKACLLECRLGVKQSSSESFSVLA